jgi:hypothetical protein
MTATTYNDSNTFSTDAGILFIDRVSTVDDRTPGKNTAWLSSLPKQLDVTRKPNGNIWRTFDEETSAWSSVIGVDGEIAPTGNIFPINPPLQFINDDGNAKQTSLYDLFNFFFSESNINVFAGQWIDLFVNKTKVYCSVKGTAYRLGDSFVTTKNPRIPGGKYVVKKAVGKLMQERTTIELIKA